MTDFDFDAHMAAEVEEYRLDPLPNGSHLSRREAEIMVALRYAWNLIDDLCDYTDYRPLNYEREFDWISRVIDKAEDALRKIFEKSWRQKERNGTTPLQR